MRENVDKSAVEKDGGCTSPIKWIVFNAKELGEKHFVGLIKQGVKRLGDSDRKQHDRKGDGIREGRAERVDYR